MTHSVAIIDACRPWSWRDKFPPTNTPSAAVARKAQGEVRLAAGGEGQGLEHALLKGWSRVPYCGFELSWARIGRQRTISLAI